MCKREGAETNMKKTTLNLLNGINCTTERTATQQNFHLWMQGLKITSSKVLWIMHRWFIPVVTDHGDTDQSAAADCHRDEKSQPVGAAFCKHQKSKALWLTWVNFHLKNHLNHWAELWSVKTLPAGASGGRVGCRSLLQKSVLQHSIVLLVWALGESCQSNQSNQPISQSNHRLHEDILCINKWCFCHSVTLTVV